MVTSVSWTFIFAIIYILITPNSGYLYVVLYVMLYTSISSETCISRTKPVLHFLQLGNRNGFHRIVFTWYFTQLILDGIRQIIKQIHIYLGVITLDTGKNFHARSLIECLGYDIAFWKNASPLKYCIYGLHTHSLAKVSSPGLKRYIRTWIFCKVFKYKGAKNCGHMQEKL